MVMVIGATTIGAALMTPIGTNMANGEIGIMTAMIAAGMTRVIDTDASDLVDA